MSLQSWTDACELVGMSSKLAERRQSFSTLEAQEMHDTLVIGLSAPEDELQAIEMTYIDGPENREHKFQGAAALAPLMHYLAQGKFRVLKTYVMHLKKEEENG